MVTQYAIDFVSEEQIQQIIDGKKIAFIRMEDEWLEHLKMDFDTNYESKTQLIIGIGKIKGWLYVVYVDYFKWRELKIQPELIQKCGFEDKKGLKEYLIKLYGIELEEDNYLYYIEFELEPF